MNRRQSAVAATIPASPPGASQAPGAQISGGQSSGRAARAQAGPAPQIKWGTLFKYGWKLLRLFPGLVVLYLILSLATAAIGAGGAQLFGFLTNQIGPVNATEHAAGQTVAARSASPSGPEKSLSQRLTDKYLGWAKRSLAKMNPRSLLTSAYVGWVILAIGGIALAIPVSWWTTKMDALLSNRLRSDLFNRVLRQSPEFFYNYDSGQLNAIINQMTIETEMTLRQIILEPPLQFVILIGTTAVVSYDFWEIHKGALPLLGMRLPSIWIPPIVVVLSLFLPYIISRMSGLVRKTAKAVQIQMLALSSLITGATQSPEEIQVMEAENIFCAKHDASLKKSLDARLHQAVTVQTLNFLNQMPTLLIQIALLGFAVWLVLRPGGNARPGDIVRVVLLAPFLMLPIQKLSGLVVTGLSAWPNIETVVNIMESRVHAEERPSVPNGKTMAPTIEARNVTFSYKPGAPPVFTNLSFTVPPQKTTGFVAKMGQGKTTFFKLALRFYDPQQGQILVGGQPTTDYSPELLRQRIAMMSQFPAFFFDTVRENLRMAKSDATDQELQAICERTGVWKILSQKLPPSQTGSILDADLAAGKTLSGGQRKLLALTRCLLRDPALLFLDEPTVGMDNEEKFEIREMLREGTRGKTVMVVDHDVNWLLQFCDYFVVLDEGTIVEHGTAQELLCHDGLLYQLYMAAMGPKTKEIATYIARV
jgi:ATP-binding cassette, subfamily B, bacterial